MLNQALRAWVPPGEGAITEGCDTGTEGRNLGSAGTALLPAALPATRGARGASREPAALPHVPLQSEYSRGCPWRRARSVTERRGQRVQLPGTRGHAATTASLALLRVICQQLPLLISSCTGLCEEGRPCCSSQSWDVSLCLELSPAVLTTHSGSPLQENQTLWHQGMNPKAGATLIHPIQHHTLG